MKTVHWFAPLLAVSALGAAAAARAEEGMWTLDNLPLQQIQKTYGFTPSAQWIDKVMHASARLALGCSASFVSPDGLVMTNHHCVAGCLGDISVGRANYVRDGYAASHAGAEPRCPGMELDQLQTTSDVTERMDAALSGKSDADFTKAQHAAEAAIETECASGDPAHTRCDVVSLYHGGRYDLYKYRRFQDMRLAFAPEDAIANFGGDPDNFNYPRYDLDVSFLRAYVDGKPAHTEYFPFDPAGPKADEPVFVSGNPGSTSRDDTADQLQVLHDVQLPLIFGYSQNFDGVVWQFRRESAAHNKEAFNDEFYTENSLKVYTGWFKTLGEPAILAKKRADDQSLLDWINADPARKQTYGDPFAAVRATIPAETALVGRYDMLEGARRPLGFYSEDFTVARMLVRAAAERQKPDADRLPAFRDANLPLLQAQLFSSAPIYPDLEITKLAFSLTKLRQVLGADDPVVHQVLGHSSPEQLAHDLITGTKVADLNLRHALWNGGAKAIAASNDPMIRFAASVDGAGRAVLKQWQDQVLAPQTRATGEIAKARFARFGTSIYPDATFTERLSYGKVDGWTEDGRTIAPFTDFAGLYNRATGSEPFKLPANWLAAKNKLDGNTHYDFVSTNDIIGGNSGSPMIDRDAHVIGVAFDGNQPSIAGDFVYDGAQNRTVGVDTASMIAALRTVYKLDWLADELTSPHGKSAGG